MREKRDNGRYHEEAEETRDLFREIRDIRQQTEFYIQFMKFLSLILHFEDQVIEFGIMNIVPNRVFSSLYIVLDCVFLVTLFLFLLFSKRTRALVFGLFGGILYWAVDYGIFYLALHSRVVEGAPTGLFLFWLSMSYGFTNFVWIWLMLDRDKYRVEWSVLIFFSWIAVALLSQNFGSGWHQITIWRTTTAYHGVMALMLIVGYAFLVYQNVFRKRNINIPYLLFIGITVQLGWEAALLITGIRQAGIATLIINSLIETNLGMPYIYYIHRALSKKLDEKKIMMLPEE